MLKPALQIKKPELTDWYCGEELKELAEEL